MTATCDSYLQGIRLRATKLDACGAPVAGAGGYVVTKGFISVEIEDDVAKGQEIGPMLADGTRCYYRITTPQLNGVKVNIEFCEVDPELFNLLTGCPLITDDAVTPNTIGFTTDDQTYATGNVALELWTNLNTGSCPVGTLNRRWGYYLLPWLTNGMVGKPKIENDAVNFNLSDGITRSGNQWGYGPHYIQRDSAGNAARLFTPLSTTAHDLISKVNLAPPDPVCGTQTLVLAT
jgi:hypothetical protein